MSRLTIDRSTAILVACVSGLTVALVAAVSVLLASANKTVDETLEITRALTGVAGSVIVTGVLGVVITSTLARRDRERERRDELSILASGALQDLKAAFEKAQVARFMIRQNPTAGMLFEEAPLLFEARALLHRVQRARSVRGTPADDGAQLMLDALGRVLEEYASHYYDLRASWAATHAGITDTNRPTADNNPPLFHRGDFAALEALISDERDSPFMQGYEQAADWLTRELLQT